MSTNIYVGNLSFGTTDHDLEELFAQYGEVTRVNIIQDRETGRSRGFGFVEMASEGASEAIEALDGHELDGRDLRVNVARERERSNNRPRGGGGRGGHGGGGRGGGRGGSGGGGRSGGGDRYNR